MENGLDGYIFWVLVVMGGLDLAACDTSWTSVTSRDVLACDGDIGIDQLPCTGLVGLDLPKRLLSHDLDAVDHVFN